MASVSVSRTACRVLMIKQYALGQQWPGTANFLPILHDGRISIGHNFSCCHLDETFSRPPYAEFGENKGNKSLGKYE